MKENNTISIISKVLKFIFVLFVFLLALKLMGTTFKEFEGVSEQILNSTKSPIIGLFIGMLATAIVQSSSSTTTIIVTMAAATRLEMEFFVPMILGANIGTSVTSSLVAFGHIGKKKEYRRAVAAATVHDFFNIILVMIILPLELLFKVLSKPAVFLANKIPFSESSGDIGDFNPLEHIIKPVIKQITNFFDSSLIGDYYAWSWLIISLTLLFFALKGLSSIFKSKIESDITSKEKQQDIFKSNFSSLGWGFGLTALVQSSSITSSLIVPFVAAKKITLQKAFPFLMGANLGTTTTALLAATLAASNTPIEGKIAGLSIALVHFFFNLFGVLIFFPNKYIRNIPIKLAKKLGEYSYNNRMIGPAYVAITFFLIPLAFYFVTK